ncbi:MAG: alcohol dehydrogenase catalytic domain-containing protein [Desulfobacterales bacterium]|nr:MAG: alcohol dehydrogenase catalytic domain-containing protein [Desulfobacterales bacterium]
MDKMKTVTLFADWDPRPDFKLGSKDIDGKLSYLGSKVWRNPRLEIVDKPIPKPNPGQVIVKVKACGICGSDVHMAQAKPDGYIFYPGLTAFPCTLGHELSGVVVEAEADAINRRTNQPFETGEPVCAEEMAWCGACRPCADGYPNHCERLQEIGFSIDGAFADYIALNAKYCWSLHELVDRYDEEKAFRLGSLVEPTSVAYNAVIERGGGIRPGDSVWILGGGPIGAAACAVMKTAGASNVIISEPSKDRAKIAQKLGASHVIDPTEGNTAEQVLDITRGGGVNLILEATGLPDVVWSDIEHVIWNGRTLNTAVVIVARADAKIPVTGEVFQVRRAQIVGSQGHSGHGTFPRVISAMAAGMDMTPIITKKISLEKVPENIVMLQTDRKECKITAVM